jgi:hypothetical protein
MDRKEALDSKIRLFNNLIENRQKNLSKNPFSTNWESIKSDQTSTKLK